MRPYQHGGDWQWELVEELAGLGGGSIASSAVIELAEGPPGWVVIVGAMGANILGNFGGKTLARLLTNLE